MISSDTSAPEPVQFTVTAGAEIEKKASKIASIGITSTDDCTVTPDSFQLGPSHFEKQQNTCPPQPSFYHPHKNKWRVIAACITYFANGMNDSATGALIPYLETWYSIGYAIVSLIFITNALGFIIAAVFADAFVVKLGRSKALMTAEVLMICGYIVVACAPPFPGVVVAFLILGFGNALNLAYNNVFCANLAKSTVILGASHGSYGIGGIVAPIVATAMVSRGVPWARFYIILIGLRLFVLVFAGWSFTGYEQEQTTQLQNTLQNLHDGQQAADDRSSSKFEFLGRALRNRTTIIGALFIFLYQGAEVSESGWFITYLIHDRNGDPSKVGNVTAGFWAGITLGRFVLTHLAHTVGERKFVFGMGVAVVACQLMAWFIPTVVGDAVAVSILGLLLGPVYPCAQTIFTRLLPKEIQVIAISFISSAGSSGGAMVPFLTGLIAQTAGPSVLHPICIACFVFMTVCWALLPRSSKTKKVNAPV